MSRVDEDIRLEQLKEAPGTWPGVATNIHNTCEAARYASSVASATLSQGDTMAKALFGHVGQAPDRRMLDEVTKLRAKVRSLEFEVTRLRADNDRLITEVASTEEITRLSEPVLT